MFISLLITSIFISCLLAYLHYKNLKTLTHKIFIISAWTVLYAAVMLMCNYLAAVGLPFSYQASMVNFNDSITFDYIGRFLQLSLMYAVFIGIYLLLTKFIKPYWLTIIIGILSILVYYPGIPYSDTNDLYRYYLTHSYIDWQPDLYTIWWNIFGFYGSAFLANNFAYYIGLSYISYYLYKNGKIWQNHILVLFSMNPIFYTQLNYVFKDTLFCGLLIDTIAIYLLLQNCKQLYMRVVLYVVAFIAFFLVVGIRYNGLTSMLPLLGLILWTLFSKFNWKNITKVSVTVFATLLITYIFVQANLFITYKIFNASKAYSPSLVMENDFANIECRTNHQWQMPDIMFVSASDLSVLRQTMCDPNILNQFNYDPLFGANWNGSGNPAILYGNNNESIYNKAKAIWLKTLLTYPVEYLEYRTSFILNDMFAQYYFPPYAPMQSGSWPQGVTTPDHYNHSILDTQAFLAQISQAQHADMRYVLGLFLLIGTFGILFYIILIGNYSLALMVFLSHLFTLLGLAAVLGEHAARFFLWNYIALILALVLINARAVLKSNNIEKAKK